MVIIFNNSCSILSMLSKGILDKICSVRGCNEKATHAIVWSNPKIHVDRTKTWLSCENHKDFLCEYIALRSFPYELKTIDEI